jgi:predicted Zn-dependent protease
MKAAAFVLSAVMLTAAPAYAQLGGLGKIKSAADKAADAKGKYDDYNITEQEERQLGDQVSLKLRDRFGVVQSEAVTKYVSLVGTALAQASTRPNLDWKFIVLDTDGVNAYAAPGGIVHITRGLLGLIKNEAELAGVLGHEITHVSEKHTVNAIKQGKLVNMGAEASGSAAGGSMRDQFVSKMAGAAFNHLFDGAFSRKDENEADQIGIRLANKLGYSPAGMVNVLKKIDARNTGRETRNGMFASHPDTTDRIEKLEKQIGSEKLTAKATVDARYKKTITYDVKPASEIAVDVSGAAGLASGDKKKGDDPKAADAKKDEPKKKGFGLASIKGDKQQASTQQASSAGARGLGGPDRDAVGGTSKNALGVKVTAAELEAFKKGIVA